MKSIKIGALAFLAATATPVAFAATDENGLEPTHWYKFDGDRTSFGSAAINFDGGYGSLSYVDSASGQALQLGDPWCSKHAALGTAFTFVTEAKSTTEAGKRVLWGRGDAHNRSVGLYAEGNTIGFFCWDNTSNKKAGWYNESAARVLVSTTVADATTCYHSYAVVYDGSVLSLYVDGVKAADTSALTDMISFDDLSNNSTGSFQLGSMHGTLGGGMAKGTGCFIDDYRYYSQALTSDQLTAISSSFSLRHHYKFDGNLNSSGAQALGIGGTCLYVPSPEGQALAKSDAYCSNHASFTSSFSIVASAKSGTYPDRKGVVWARGTNTGNAIGLYLFQKTVGLFKVTNGAAPAFFATTTVADAVENWHSYGVVFEEGKLNLYVDGVKSTAEDVLEIENPAEFVSNGNFQVGSVYGGKPSGMWPAFDARVLIDDYRYYTAKLSSDQLSALAAPVSGKAGPCFAFSPIAGNAPWGWIADWEWNKFLGPDFVVGPGATGLIYPVTTGSNNHGGSGLVAADKRSFAVYANLEKMTLQDQGVYYTVLCVGGSGAGNRSVNLICYRNAEGRRYVKLAYINSAAHDGGLGQIDVTDLKGYHLFVFSYDSEVGTTLSIDGGAVETDTSEKAKFKPTNGLQIGATWENQVFRLGEGAAVAQVLGYDTVLTADEIATLATKFPATQTVTTDIDMTTNVKMTSATDMTVAEGKRIGISNGTWEIPAGVTVEAERVRCMNRGTSEDVATLNLAGTLTINADGTSADVYNNPTGVLFGHYRGVGTYNITGTLDASRAYVQLRYSAADQTVNVNGGTLKAKGVSYANTNGATGDVIVNLSNGARVEVSEATGFQTPCAVLAGANTLKVGKTYTHTKALSIAENASLTVEVAPEQTMTFGADAAVSGAGVFRKAGEGAVVFTDTAPQQIELAAGTVTVPATYTGTVKSVVKGLIPCRKTTAEGAVTYYLGTSFSISIR